MAAKKTATKTAPTKTSSARKLADFAPDDLDVFEVELSDRSTVEMEGLVALPDDRTDALADAIDAFTDAARTLSGDGEGVGALRAFATIRRAATDVVRASVADPERAEALLADPAMKRTDSILALVDDYLRVTMSGESSRSDG